MTDTLNTDTNPRSLLLVTTAHPSLITHTLNGEVHPNLGRLIQPRHTSSIEATAAAGIPWAADNDCFQGLDEKAFVRMLDRLEGIPGCLFVTVPDVVGDCAATLAQFDKWAPELERRGLPLALVAQDGLEDELESVQWDRIAAIFIGGSTEWKEGAGALAVAREAKAHGKWVHWGRVNTRRRFDLIVAGGAYDSFDGSKWARFRKTYLDGGLEWLRSDDERRRNEMKDHEIDETPAEELGRLRRELSELDRETPEHRDTLDRIAVLVREAAVARRYRFEVDTRADDETDAAIVAEVLAGAVKDERNDPDEPVEVRFRPLEDALPANVDPGDRGPVYVAFGACGDDPEGRWYVVEWRDDDGPVAGELLYPDRATAREHAADLGRRQSMDVVYCDERGHIGRLEEYVVRHAYTEEELWRGLATSTLEALSEYAGGEGFARLDEMTPEERADVELEPYETANGWTTVPFTNYEIAARKASEVWTYDPPRPSRFN